MAYISRRRFLSGTGALGFASSVGALSSLSAAKAWAATDTSGYKAMVCVFLKGGMDHADTVLPYDQASYNQLVQAREGLLGAYNYTDAGSTRNRANLLQLNPANAGSLGGRQMALPPELAPLKTLFDSGDLAILGNVGPLIEPTTRASYDNGTALLPPRLFSHNDQQSTWMSFGVEGRRLGWGGRFADAALAAAPSSDPAFAAISTGSNDVFLSGDNARPYRVTSSGAAEPYLLSRRYYLGGTSGDDEARQRIRDFLAGQSFNDRNIYAQDIRNSNGRAVETAERLLTARENEGPFAAPFGDDSLSRQLRSVAETIKIQSYLNAPRQIFYVTTGGYDTHNAQANAIGGLHATLAAAITSFKAAMDEINQWNNVAVFTMSDFGRTLIDNGDGTDHGWGAHHFIAGGRVAGNRIYGDIPSAEPDSEFYTPSRGRLIPTTSVEQYAATLGRWFGLDTAALNMALPNLGNFNGADLGFMS
ncbi:DUF1501 domain-containing protein [Hyphomonas sp. FCG-A18]|uniref:DUF1501 domain-containing protein n=1 Tax=Hyphomonas sp. FCG-A18 TaxID=3080019 RepID=UPI002B31E469|nr:DUF1501 domain-containing protein [Hyphomonas sp. FCG-A18]